MRLSVRKSGEVILGMSELEAVTMQDVMKAVNEASEQNPEFFNRTQKAVVKDAYKNIMGLDAAIAEMEKRTASSEDEGEEESVPTTEPEKPVRHIGKNKPE